MVVLEGWGGSYERGTPAASASARRSASAASYLLSRLGFRVSGFGCRVSVAFLDSRVSQGFSGVTGSRVLGSRVSGFGF